MKTALIRVLLLVSLAVSLTTAAAGESKRHDAVTVSGGTEQNGSASSRHEKKDKEKKDRKGSTPEEQEFKRTLMAIYG